jgi:hypothetical protein
VLIQSAQLLQVQYCQLLSHQEGEEPWLHGSHSQIERSCHIPNSGIPPPQIACTRMLFLGQCSELDIGFGHVNKWPLIVGLPDTSHKTICRPVPFVNRPSWSSRIVQLCFSFSCHVKYVLLLRTQFQFHNWGSRLQCLSTGAMYSLLQMSRTSCYWPRTRCKNFCGVNFLCKWSDQELQNYNISGKREGLTWKVERFHAWIRSLPAAS